MDSFDTFFNATNHKKMQKIIFS